MAVQTIETITSQKDLLAVCEKRGLAPVNHPPGVLSRVAQLLYEAQEGENFAVCISRNKFELVKYETVQELARFAKDEGYDGLAIGNGLELRVMVSRPFFDGLITR